VAGNLRLHELRQIRRRGAPSARAHAGRRFAGRAADPRDPRVDAVQILHVDNKTQPLRAHLRITQLLYMTSVICICAQVVIECHCSELFLCVAVELERL
jgi:hypothetical protein